MLNFLPCRLPALTEAVRLLSGPWLGTVERLQTVGWRLLPLLVVSSSSQSSLASGIGHSSIMAQQPLTQNWSKGETEPGAMPSLVLPAAPDEAAIKKLLPNRLYVALCSRDTVTVLFVSSWTSYVHVQFHSHFLQLLNTVSHHYFSHDTLFLVLI